jgi:hypothetical protein
MFMTVEPSAPKTLAKLTINTHLKNGTAASGVQINVTAGAQFRGTVVTSVNGNITIDCYLNETLTLIGYLPGC